MRPKRREFTVFSLSLMDMICGALGIFVILVVLLMLDANQAHGKARKSAEKEKAAQANLAAIKSDLEGKIKSLEGQLKGARSNQRSTEERLAASERKNKRLKRRGPGGGGHKNRFKIYQNDAWKRFG